MKIAVHSYQVKPGYASVLEWNLPFEILNPPLKYSFKKSFSKSLFVYALHCIEDRKLLYNYSKTVGYVPQTMLA